MQDPTSRNLPATLQQLPTLKNQVELTNALEKLKEHFNVLVPAQLNFSSPLHKVALEAVQLDPRVDEKKNGVDVYSPEGGDRYTLHYKAANKIAGAAGINWTSSKIVRRDLGDDSRVIFIEHSVTYEVKRPNGSVKKGAASGFYRFEEDKKKFANPKQVEARRRFAEALAESNAKLRAIFEALEQLPRHFTLEELKKPFLVPCVIEDINELAKDDPEIRRMIAAQALGMTEQIYGTNRPQQSRHDPNEIQAAASVVEDAPPGQVPPTAVDKKTGEIPMDEKTYKASWLTSKPAERKAELDRLLGVKGATWAFGTKFEDLEPSRQVDALWHFFSQPDKTAEQFPWEGRK